MRLNSGLKRTTGSPIREDLRSVSALAALADSVAADHGALHILVNCQGTTEIKPAIELTESEYDTILDTNLKSVFFACTAFGRGMIARGEGVDHQYLLARGAYGLGQRRRLLCEQMGRRRSSRRAWPPNGARAACG